MSYYLKLYLCLFLPISLFAIPGAYTQLGSQSAYYCYQDEIGNYLVKKKSGSFKDLRFSSEINSQNKRLEILLTKRDKFKKTWSKSQLSANRQRIANSKKLIKDIKRCRSGVYNGSTQASEYSEACQVVGDTLTTSSEVSQIINGNRCLMGNSSTVRLRISTNDGSTFACTGTFIAPGVVLSAAHCLVDENNNFVTTAVSVITANNSYDAVHFVSHPQYNALSSNFESFDFSIIIILNQDLPNKIAPVLANNDLVLGEEMIIGGYGIDERGGSGILKAGKMNLFNYNTHKVVGRYTGSGSNTCSGDSGGPLYVKRNGVWTLAAVTSNGIRANCSPVDISNFGNITSPEARSFISIYVPSI